MTTPNDRAIRHSPSGFVTGRSVDVLRQIEETGAAVDSGLPVRLYHPVEGAGENVVAHFQYSPHEPWSIFGDLSRGLRGLVISRMELMPEEGSSGVTAGLLRKIPIGEVLSAVRAKAAWESARREGTRVILGEEPAPGLFEQGDDKPPRRGGRAPMAPELLREVALSYLRETAPGMPAGAAKRMGEQFGRPEETIRTWITRARKDGWLGPSTKGRAGAEPGPKLLGWAGEAMREAEPLLKEANRIAGELGATVSGQVRAAVRAYEREEEQALAKRLGVHPLVASIASEVLFGKSLSAEVAERATQTGSSADSALDAVGQEVHQLIAGRGITVTLPAD